MSSIQTNTVDKKQIVSFDIFDTLLHRLVSAPVDVFDAVRANLMIHKVSVFYPKLIENFSSLRRKAEFNARAKRIEAFGGEGEVTFDEIYDELNSLCPHELWVRELLQETELKLERKLFYRSESGYRIYYDAISSGCVVIFISDMYLSSAFLIETLNELGYHAANKSTVFVSNEFRCSKHSGALYRKINDLCKFSLANWLHYGDNEHSDVAMAKQFGISAQLAHWARVSNIPRNTQKIADAIPQSIIDGMTLPQHKSIFQTQDEFERLGYEVFGPFMFGFYVWLHRQFQSFMPDKVLFFARDAQLLQKIHALVSSRYTRFGYPHDYVYISRASTYPLSFSEFSFERIWHMLSGKTPKSMKDVCHQLGIDSGILINKFAEFGLTDLTILNTDELKKKAHDVISTEFLSLSQSSAKQYQEYHEYFTNFVSDSSKIAIVDIGWHGNIQVGFNKCILDEKTNTQVKGFYIGLLPGASLNLNEDTQMSGWSVNIDNQPTHCELLYQGGVEILEFVLSANHGSTLGYKKQQNGQIKPILEEKTHSELDYEQKAFRVQRGILKFIENYCFLMDSFPLDALDSLQWSKPFFDLVESPSMKYADLLGDLTHADSIGENSNRIYLAKRLSFYHRVFKTKRYRTEKKKSFWKKAFLLRNKIFFQRTAD